MSGSAETGTEAVRGVVVAHGDLGEALIRAVERIAGASDGLVAVSNEGRAPEEMRRLVREAVGDGPCIIFTDLASGSCAFTGRLVAGGCRGVAVVTGTNLPMLLDFAFHRRMPIGELVERLEGKARGGIQVHLPEVGGTRADRSVSG